ncbi:MAG: hypothetical protein AAGI37_15325 [Planctomycetota bacterium]
MPHNNIRIRTSRLAVVAIAAGGILFVPACESIPSMPWNASDVDGVIDAAVLVPELSDDQRVVVAGRMAGVVFKMVARKASEAEKKKAEEVGDQAVEELTPEQRERIIEENDGKVLAQVDEDTFMEYDIQTREVVNDNAYDVESEGEVVIDEGEFVEVNGQPRMVLTG